MTRCGVSRRSSRAWLGSPVDGAATVVVHAVDDHLPGAIGERTPRSELRGGRRRAPGALGSALGLDLTEERVHRNAIGPDGRRARRIGYGTETVCRPMAPRSIWNGTITFGIVNVPIKLYTATESKSVHFHVVHARDGSRVEHRRICSKEDKEVPFKQVVKGYEVSQGKYVVLEHDEIKAAAGDRGKVIHLDEFVDAAEIDPVFFEKTYYVGSRDDEDAYRLLHEALGRSGRAGIGRFTFHDREYLVALRALDDVLALHTLRFHDEVVAGDDLEIDSGGRKPSKREVQMAKQLDRLAAAELRPRGLRGQLPRGGARPHQAQGRRQGDRPRRPGGARARGRPAWPRSRPASAESRGAERGRARSGAARSASGWSTCRSSWSAPPATSTTTSTSSTRRTRRASSSAATARRRTSRSAGRRSPTATTSTGKQVVVTDEELASVEPRKTRTIDIEAFVDLAEVDPIYFDHPYFLVPAGESEGTLRAYRLLVEVMAEQERVALGRFVMRTKEYLVAVQVRDGALALTTMLFHDEVGPTRPFPTGGKKPAKRRSTTRWRSSRSSRPTGIPRATPTATGSGCAR